MAAFGTKNVPSAMLCPTFMVFFNDYYLKNKYYGPVHLISHYQSVFVNVLKFGEKIKNYYLGLKLGPEIF